MIYFQEIDENVITEIVSDLITLSSDTLNDESMNVFHASLKHILDVARTRALSKSVLNNIYEIFCEVCTKLDLNVNCCCVL